MERGAYSEHKEAVAACFLKKAKIETDEQEAAQLLLARKWDHNVNGLKEISRPLAEKLDLEVKIEWLQKNG